MFNLKKLTKRKFDGLDGFTHVTWEDEAHKTVARATQEGVQFHTPTLTQHLDLVEFAKLVDMAWTEHKKLVPKITKTLTGHG